MTDKEIVLSYINRAPNSFYPDREQATDALSRLTDELARKDSEIESHKTTRRMWQERAGELTEELARKDAALRGIARQKLSGELEEHDYDCADWEYGYDGLIKIARAALGEREKEKTNNG